MKRRYEVRWYECDLTEMRYRRFFTEKGASLYAWYLKNYQQLTAKIYKR